MTHPTVNLISVYDPPAAPFLPVTLLYDMLKERTPDQSISHKKMPTPAEHMQFFLSKPYAYWFLISPASDVYVGNIYFTKQREVGIHISSAFIGCGYGSAALAALRQIIQKNNPGPIYANINPKNLDSIEFFKKHGAKLIQNTYTL